MSEINLNGRVCIVTGASQGLGMAMAEGLARAGGRVVICSPDQGNLERVADGIGRSRCLPIVADITVESDCQRVLKEAIATFGELHVLVNNARYAIPKGSRSIADPDIAFWRRAVEVNVFGTFLMTATIAPHLTAQRHGRIINITTSLDTIQRAGNSPYGVTKAAIEAQTLIWAQDLAGTGVTVNSLIPGGACATNPKRQHPPSREGSQLLPIDVMSAAVVWLASELSDGETGRRYVGKLWDANLPPREAARKAIEPSVFRPAEFAS